MQVQKVAKPSLGTLKSQGQQAESNAKFALLRRQFVHLPSVGTWLRRLPDPIKVCPEPTLSQKMRNVKAWQVARRIGDWLV